MKTPIIIYKDHLLPISQTFVKEQTLNLSFYKPIIVGSRRLRRSLDLSSYTVFAVNSNNSFFEMISEYFYKVHGVQPKFLQDLRNLEPQLVHSHFGPDAVFANRLASSLNLPLIITFHGYEVTTEDAFAKKSFYSHKLYVKERENIQKSGTKFISVSHFIENLLVKQGFPREKVITHYIGVDLDKFQPNDLVQRSNIVLFVGRLVEKKGCEYLIRAMADVQRVVPDVELVIIGEGKLRPQLERMAAEKLCKYRFLGSQPSSIVKEWMSRAKVFSVPSIVAKSGDAEAFGIVFAEAQAMKLPVVSFSSGGIPEAVLNNETGFLVPEKDWQSLAKKNHHFVKG